MNRADSVQWVVVDQVIDGTGAPPTEDVAIAISSGSITEIRPARGLKSTRRPILERRGCTLMPGLIDAHVHLTLGHGSDHETTRLQAEKASSVELGLRAVRNAQKCLVAGVTTVRDCGEPGFVTLALRDAAQEGWIRAPRILASGRPITTTGGHLHWAGIEADSAVEVRRAARLLGKAGVDVIKVMATGGNMTSCSNALLPQYATEDLEEAVAEARRFGIHVAAHVLSRDGIERCVDAGVHTLEHCVWGSNGDERDVDLDIVKRMAANGTWCGVTLSGLHRRLLSTGDDVSASGKKLERLKRELQPVGFMNEIGVEWMISSDAGVRFTRFEDFYLSLACAVYGLEISPAEAIHRATLSPARALGFGSVLGSIEIGKYADFLLVEGDPGTHISDVRRIKEVWQKGERVVNAGFLAQPKDIHAELSDFMD